jgi:hypothetical protein
MPKFYTTRTYSLVVGAILFLVGFFGLSFRTTLDLPVYYLFGCLILGFWGIVSGANASGMNGK